MIDEIIDDDDLRLFRSDSFGTVISPKHVQVENDGTFVIHHSGGDVRYRAEDFLERNRDYLSADLITVMRKSTNTRLASIFINKMTKTGHVTSDPTNSWSTNDNKKQSLDVSKNNKVS